MQQASEGMPSSLLSPVLKYPLDIGQAPMYEHLASFFGGLPNEYHLALYSLWSQQKWGMVITGNVQVTGSHLTLGRDLVVPDQIDEETLKSYKNLLKAIKGSDCQALAIMQLSHAGRQSANVIGGRYPFKRPLGPSPVKVGADAPLDGPIANVVHDLLFQTPKQMSTADINTVKERFIAGARLAFDSGFDGVELHAAHGCECRRLLASSVLKV